MAFLDFIKNRQQQAASPQEQKPETTKQPQTAREMYAQQDAPEKATQAPLTPEVKAQADRAMETLDKSSFHLRSQSAASPSETGGNSEPMRQNAVNQDKAAPALSPTTEQMGKVAEKESAAPSNEPAKEQPQKSQARRHDRGGWER